MSRRSERQFLGWAPFERLADRYDDWFDSPAGCSIFQVEVECLRDLLEEMPRPWLEVGVGTGRFAAALDIDEGIDPSAAVLRYAGRRNIRVRIGRAEELPCAGNQYGIMLLVVTICFLDDPVLAFSECRRVLRDDGFVVVGLVPQDSPWGGDYARKGAAGHPFYSAAKFYTARQIIALADQAGFYLDRAASCLFEKPGRNLAAYCCPKEGIVKNAGFVGMRFGKK